MFLYLPFQAVHAPLEATKFWLNKQQPLAAFGNSTDRRTYAAMVANMDFAVGKVVTALQTVGMWDNTLLILSADNGGIEPGGFNYPLRGQKATLWDGGMRANGFITSPLLKKTGCVPLLSIISTIIHTAACVLAMCLRVKRIGWMRSTVAVLHVARLNAQPAYQVLCKFDWPTQCSQRSGAGAGGALRNLGY